MAKKKGTRKTADKTGVAGRTTAVAGLPTELPASGKRPIESYTHGEPVGVSPRTIRERSNVSMRNTSGG